MGEISTKLRGVLMGGREGEGRKRYGVGEGSLEQVGGWVGDKVSFGSKRASEGRELVVYATLRERKEKNGN